MTLSQDQRDRIIRALCSLHATIRNPKQRAVIARQAGLTIDDLNTALPELGREGLVGFLPEENFVWLTRTGEAVCAQDESTRDERTLRGSNG